MDKIGPYDIFHHRRLFPLTKDPFLLCDFILPLKRHDKVIDIGTGTAVIPLYLASKSDVESITGVEVQPEVFGVAEKNVEANGLGARIRLLRADYRELTKLCPKGSFTVVASNPPYMRAGSGRPGPFRERAVARHELMGTLKDLVRVTAHLLAPAGRASFIYPKERLDEMMDELKRAGLSPVRLRFVHTKDGKGARFFLIEARYKCTALKVEEPLFM